MAFTAKDVQSLREKTGCGMMDCKKALTACDGNMDAAVDYLREKGLAQAAKKADRVAAEGLVAVRGVGGATGMVEINAETDFVANSDGFRALCKKVAEVVARDNPADLDALNDCEYEGVKVSALVQELFLVVRENIKIRRFVRYEGRVASYVHGGGKIGVMVKFADGAPEGPGFAELGKSVAMQVAAMNPTYVDRANVPAEVLDKEKAILVAQMKEDPKMANKPEQVLHKIVEGKLGKFYSEVCLLQQDYAFDSNYTVESYIKEKAKDLGGSVAVESFVRYEKGEGIQKKEEDFAGEVASMIK